MSTIALLQKPAWRSALVLGPIVDQLCAPSALLDAERGRRERYGLPSREALEGIARGLRAALFPAHFGPPDLGRKQRDTFVEHMLTITLEALQEQVARGLRYAENSRPSALTDEIIYEFAQELPRIRALIETDVRAAFDGDPAATSLDEAMFCYPGVSAITQHRLAHALHRLGVPLIPRILAELAHAETGIDIHPGASIGSSFFIDHGTGVVLGETSQIGNHVRLYQGVTLGAKSFPVDDNGQHIKGVPRHPIVEDDVVIYAGATILGRVRIGKGSTIGGNVWITRNVPPHSRVTQSRARKDGFEDGNGI